MKLHVIIDFMHIYYKYLFQLKAGKIKRLTCPANWNGSFCERDISLIYYPLKDIENIRKELEETQKHDVTISVCFDTKSKRTEGESSGADQYKSGRQNVLNDEDFFKLSEIERLLKLAGHNVYKVEGYEADDLINYWCKHRENFDHVLIYTNDKDILVNIDEHTSVMRFKSTHGYSYVTMNNYETYLENEFGIHIPYNALGLFLSTAGDSADKIKGISKFGKVAFTKLIAKVDAKYKVDWSVCGDYSKLHDVVVMCKEFLTSQQYEELEDSYKLVANMELDIELEPPVNKGTHEKRKQAYSEYNMTSLTI